MNGHFALCGRFSWQEMIFNSKLATAFMTAKRACASPVLIEFVQRRT